MIPSRHIARLAMGALTSVFLISLLASGSTASTAGFVDRVVLNASFDNDAVDQPPNTSLPGDPPGDSLVLRQGPGDILVRAAVGTLTEKPISVSKDPGVSSVELAAILAPAPDCGTVAAEWRSLLVSPANCFITIAVEGSAGQRIAAIEYRPGGVLYYHPGARLLPVSYTPDIDQRFRITVDLAAQTTGLEIDGVMISGFQAVPFESPAASVAAIGFAGGCTDNLDFAIDDIRATATCPFDFKPVLTVPPVIVAEEGGFVSFSVSASDPDGEPITSLTADLTGLPPGDAAFVANASHTSGTFTWHPLAGDAALYPIVFTASNALSVTDTTRLYVVLAGTAVIGTFLWTPGAGAEGEYDIVFTATNVFNESSTLTTHMTILPAEGAQTAPLGETYGTMAPQIPTRGPIISGTESKSGHTGDLIEVTVTAADAGDAAGSTPLAAARLPGGASAGAGSLQAASGLAAEEGPITLTADLTELPEGHSAVFNVDDEPIVSAPSAVTGQESDLVTVAVGVSDPDGDPIERLQADLSNLPPSHGATFVTSPSNVLGTLEWTPAFGQAGSYTVTFTANNLLVGAAATTIVVEAALGAEVFQWGRDKRLRLGSNRSTPWCAYVEPIGGSFDLSDVDYTTVSLVSEGTGSVSSIPAISNKSIVVGDRDRDLTPDVKVCFTVEDLRQLFSALSGRVTVPVAIEGRLLNGRLFRAPTTLDVQAAGSTVEASVAPNPLNPGAVLAVSTVRPGHLRIRLYDASGRLVRMLHDAFADAGDYEIPIDGRSRTGAALSSGVYYYRVESGDQITTGRFSILK